MEEIDISVDERNKLKDCLRSHQSFRKTIGYATGAKAAINPDKKASFLAGTTPAAEELFLTCAELIYSRTWDIPLPARLVRRQEYARGCHAGIARKGHSLNPSMTKASVETGEDRPPDAASDVECAGSASEQEAEEQKRSSRRSWAWRRSPAKAHREAGQGWWRPDRGTHIGTILAGEELWSKDLKPELARQIWRFLRQCIEIVDRDCGVHRCRSTTIPRAVIAAKIREHSDSIGECPDKRTAVVYCVGSSGSSQKNPSNNPPPFRRGAS